MTTPTYLAYLVSWLNEWHKLLINNVALGRSLGGQGGNTVEEREGRERREEEKEGERRKEKGCRI